jgi:hypothetical protein
MNAAPTKPFKQDNKLMISPCRIILFHMQWFTVRNSYNNYKKSIHCHIPISNANFASLQKRIKGQTKNKVDRYITETENLEIIEIHISLPEIGML